MTLDGSEPTRKVVTEGEQMKQYTEYDVDRKFSSSYVDHDLMWGSRQWISPLAPGGLYVDSKVEIRFAELVQRAVQIEAERHGVSL